MTEEEENEVINHLDRKYWNSIRAIQQCIKTIKSTPYMDSKLRSEIQLQKLENTIRARECMNALLFYGLNDKQLTQLIKPYGIFQKN